MRTHLIAGKGSQAIAGKFLFYLLVVPFIKSIVLLGFISFVSRTDFCERVLISPGHTPKNATVGLYGRNIFIFIKAKNAKLFSRWPRHCPLLQAVSKWTLSALSPACGIVAIPGGEQWPSIVILICILEQPVMLNTSACTCVPSYLLASEMPVHIYCQCLNWLLLLFFGGGAEFCEFSGYSTFKFFVRLWFASISSKPVPCHFSLSLGWLAEQKFFILMKFTFNSLWVISKTSLLGLGAQPLHRIFFWNFSSVTFYTYSTTHFEFILYKAWGLGPSSFSCYYLILLIYFLPTDVQMLPCCL